MNKAGGGGAVFSNVFAEMSGVGVSAGAGPRAASAPRAIPILSAPPPPSPPATGAPGGVGFRTKDDGSSGRSIHAVLGAVLGDAMQVEAGIRSGGVAHMF